MNLHKIESLAHLHHTRLIRNASLLAVGMSALLLGGCMRTGGLLPIRKAPAVSFQSSSQMRAEHTDLRTALGHKDFTAPKLIELFYNRNRVNTPAISKLSIGSSGNTANRNAELRLGEHYVLARPSVKSSNNFSEVSNNVKILKPDTISDAMTYHLSNHTLDIRAKKPGRTRNLPRNFVRYVSYHLHSVAKAKHGKELKLVLRPTKLEMRNRVMHHLNHNEQKDYPLTIITRPGNHDYYDGLKPDGVLPKE